MNFLDRLFGQKLDPELIQNIQDVLHKGLSLYIPGLLPEQILLSGHGREMRVTVPFSNEITSQIEGYLMDPSFRRILRMDIVPYYNDGASFTLRAISGHRDIWDDIAGLKNIERSRNLR